MSISKFLTLPRRGAGYCTTLVALAILAAPGLAWAQTCNVTDGVSKNPGGNHELGDIVRVSYTFGAGLLQDVPGLTINAADSTPGGNSVVKLALDCIDGLSAGGRERCLGFQGFDATLEDDGDAILYAGNLAYGSLVGAVCDGITFTPDSAGSPGTPAEFPNLVTFTANDVLEFQQNETCSLAFDVVMNSISNTPEASATQVIRASAGFEGTCIPEIIGANSSPSLAYFIELDGDAKFTQAILLDGGPWADANTEPPLFPTGFVPTSTAQYRLTVTNTGEEALVDVVLNDATLGLTNVPLPASCLVDGAFQPNDPCVIESGDAGFEPLGTPPVDICLTEGLKTNLACTNGNGVFSGLPAGEACDPANVRCVMPELTVTKDGPPLAKVGDEITYTICAENTGSVDLANCQLSDTLLGSPAPTPFAALLVPAQEVCNNYLHTILPGGPDPLHNEATVTCDVVGSASTVDDTDIHDVNLFEPSIDVTKTGPAEGKVGDDVCYDISFTNTSSADTPALVNCTGIDSLMGPLDGTFESGVVRQFCRIIEAGDPDTLTNRVDITCDVLDFDNNPTDFDTHDVVLFEVGAELTKACTPKPTIMVPDPISWEICVENTGDKAIDCTINDPMAGIVDGLVSVPALGTDCSTTASRPTTSADVPSVTNTATAVCTVPGYDNELPPYTATDTCVVDEPGDELCRTPGFWKTHAGVEKDGRSNNLTQAVIDYNGGTLGEICGVEIMDTSTYNYAETGYDISNGYKSAVEGMCVHPKQQIIRQLQRQLIAASLNCVASGGGADCTGISVEQVWKDANADCAANTGNLSDWVDDLDDFNNGEAPYTCTENIKDSIVFDGWTGPKVPGPAGSSWACGEATSNDFYLVPPPPGPTP